MPFMQQVIIDTKMHRQLHQCISLAMPRYANVLYGVVALFFSRRPSTIRFTVRAIVIDPIKRCAWRLWSHIKKESTETIPSWIMRYPASSVAVVLIVFLVVASLFHAGPRIMGRTVYSGDGVWLWTAQRAATAYAFPISQGDAEDFTGRSTVTLAQVIHYFLPSCSADHIPLSKFLASEVYV